MAEACKEVLMMNRFLQKLSLKQDNYAVYCDSQGVIHLANNSTCHSRSKHIDVRYHWIGDVSEKKLLHLEKIHTNENEANMTTKPSSKGKLEISKQAW